MGSALKLPLQDARGRRKRKLRLSLTDRCNLRCVYCMPERPHWLPRADMLTRHELLRIARLFVTEMGIEEIRLTGGEPLLRKDAVEIVEALQALRPLGLQRIGMTSNGTALPRYAQALRDAGLDDINISLDAVEPDAFRALTGGEVAPVLRGIEAARDACLPVKINSVVMRGHNQDQVLPLVRWALDRELTLRFIEFMPLDGRGIWNGDKVVREADIVNTLRSEFQLQSLPETDDPAHYWLLDGRYRLGMISTISKPFCRRCDRVRVSATGKLHACLFSAQGAELGSPMRSGASDTELISLARGQVWNKEAGYLERPGYTERPITMHVLGG